MTELGNHEVVYEESELNDKLLDALPTKWDVYTLLIKESNGYKIMTLDMIVEKLRAYNLGMLRKDAGSD